MHQQQTENNAEARDVDTLHNMNSFCTETVEKFADQLATSASELNSTAAFKPQLQIKSSNEKFQCDKLRASALGCR
jgi:hypothetical protein